MTTARTPGPDEMFCSSCGSIVKKAAVVCVHCGVPLKPAGAPGVIAPGKSKALAIVLAVFFAYWTWLYTYQKDGKKFWIGFVLAVVTGLISSAALVAGAAGCVSGATSSCLSSVSNLGGLILLSYAVGFGLWLWALIDRIAKSGAWYVNYHAAPPAGASAHP